MAQATMGLDPGDNAGWRATDEIPASADQVIPPPPEALAAGLELCEECQRAARISTAIGIALGIALGATAAYLALRNA